MTTTTHRPEFIAHYNPKMAPTEVRGYSRSPTKPRRFMDFVERQTPLLPFMRTFEDFLPVTDAQLLTAHEFGYVQSFMEGRPIVDIANSRAPAYQPSGSGMTWSRQFRDSVLWTNGSLISATRGALLHPDVVQLSPTSGFHHAGPGGGQGYCTFSGQVIAAVDAWTQYGKRGAWIDLDGHFGNSIEDTRGFCPALEQAIPVGCNINPEGFNAGYLADLKDKLRTLHAQLVHGRVDYVCVALGADNHEHDALVGEGHLTTHEWIEAADSIFATLSAAGVALGRPVPVVLALFGGYRDDHPESVLGLHAMGLASALYELAGVAELSDWRADVR